MGRRGGISKQHRAGGHQQEAPVHHENHHHGGKPHNGTLYRGSHRGGPRGGFNSVPPWRLKQYMQDEVSDSSDSLSEVAQSYNPSYLRGSSHTHRQHHQPHQLDLDDELLDGMIEDLLQERQQHLQQVELLKQQLQQQQQQQIPSGVPCRWQLVCQQAMDGDVDMCTCGGQIPECFAKAFENMYNQNQRLQKQANKNSKGKEKGREDEYRSKYRTR